MVAMIKNKNILLHACVQLVFAILTLLLAPLALLQLNFDLFSSTNKEEEVFHEKKQHIKLK
jgi:hypothetical protein